MNTVNYGKEERTDVAPLARVRRKTHTRIFIAICLE